jgi:hypothetical protein
MVYLFINICWILNRYSHTRVTIWSGELKNLSPVWVQGCISAEGTCLYYLFSNHFCTTKYHASNKSLTRMQLTWYESHFKSFSMAITSNHCLLCWYPPTLACKGCPYRQELQNICILSLFLGGNKNWDQYCTCNTIISYTSNYACSTISLFLRILQLLYISSYPTLLTMARLSSLCFPLGT